MLTKSLSVARFVKVIIGRIRENIALAEYTEFSLNSVNA
jgi:hypothetical protein